MSGFYLMRLKPNKDLVTEWLMLLELPNSDLVQYVSDAKHVSEIKRKFTKECNLHM